MAIGQYTTLSSLKARLGIADTSEDALLQSIVDAVNDWVESAIGRAIAPRPETELILDGSDAIEDDNGLPRLLPVPFGVVSLDTLEVAPQTGAARVAVPSEDVFLRPLPAYRPPGWPATLILLSDTPTGSIDRFSAGFDTVRLVGQFGWPAVPKDLADLATGLAVAIYRGKSAGGADTVTVGEDGTRTISRLLSTRDWQTIQRYRVRRVA